MDNVAQDIKDCFKRAKQHLKKAAQNWETNKKLMMGIGPSPQVRKENRYAYAYGLFRSLVSQVMVQTPEVYFEGITEAGRIAAKFMTDATNYDFKIGNLRSKIVRAMWQNFPYGFGLIAEDMINTKQPVDKQNALITAQKFFFRLVPTRDCLFDPDGFEIGLDDHRYIFLAYYMSVANLKSLAKSKLNPDGYFDLDNIEAFPTANQGSISLDRDKFFKDERTDFTQMTPEEYHQLKLWIMYDRMKEKCYHILDFNERHVKTEDWPAKIKIQGTLQFPVKMIALNADSDNFYPTPEIELIRSQIVNLMRLNDIWVTDMTTKLRKYAGLAPYMTKDKLSKFVDQTQPNSVLILGEDQSLTANANVMKVDSAGDAIFKLPDITPDPMLPMAIAEVQREIAQISALMPAGAPTGGPAPRSAKEAQRQNDMIQRMNMIRLSPLEQSVSDMAVYHMMLVKSQGGDLIKRYYRVSDAAAGLEMWQQYVPSQIPNEEDIFCDVYTGSSMPKNLDAKREQTLKEMSIMAPILEKNGFSLMPLLYKWADIFQIRNFDQLVKNQKGRAMEALAALVMAGQKGKQMNPGVLINTTKGLIDAVLSPAEQQAVLQALQNAQEGVRPASEGGGANAPKPAGMNADMKAPQDLGA